MRKTKFMKISDKLNISQAKYLSDFGITSRDKGRLEKALFQALDVRKFEIELYWKRAAYFWTLIAAAFGAFFAIMGAAGFNEREFFSYLVSAIGFNFTFAWFLVNKGSKMWQENWENHVFMLEDEVIGPLFKTVLIRPSERIDCDNMITAPSSFSVSKINQIVSVFVMAIWLVLSAMSFLEALARTNFLIFLWLVAGLHFAGLAALYLKTRSNFSNHVHHANQRNTRII